MNSEYELLKKERMFKRLARLAILCELTLPILLLLTEDVLLLSLIGVGFIVSIGAHIMFRKLSTRRYITRMREKFLKGS